MMFRFTQQSQKSESLKSKVLAAVDFRLFDLRPSTASPEGVAA